MTKLNYELIIKGRKAEIGDILFIKDCDNYFNVQISRILFERGYFNVRYYNIDEEEFGVTKNLDKLFWEKPVVYQLPDTDGKLSEVKIGQPVWIKYKESGNINEYIISEFNGDNIKIKYINSNWSNHIKNKEGLTISGEQATTNKPKRDFSKCVHKEEWPSLHHWWAVNENGYSIWYKRKPFVKDFCWSTGSFDNFSAGFRQDLINSETGKVDDWQDSLVERPKDVYREVRG